MKNSIRIDFICIIVLSNLIILIPHWYFKYFQDMPVYEEQPYFRLSNLWTNQELEALKQMLKDQKVFHTPTPQSPGSKVSIFEVQTK